MEKIAFYLLGKKGYHVINSFIKENSSEVIEHVVIGRDSKIENDYYDEIKELCEKHSIKTVERQEEESGFLGFKFAIGWKWIIEDTKNLIILHDSLLPKYRGFSPLVNMLINGEPRIGVTALFASKKFDEGNIINQKSILINYPIKIIEAIDLISELYSELVNDISKMIFNKKKINGIAQIEEEASYSLWRDEEDYIINWKDEASKIKRTIDAVGYPFKGAKTTLNQVEIIVDEAVICDDLKIENRDIGKVIYISDGFPAIVCGKGILLITKARYLDGNSIFPLKRFRNRFGGQKI